MARQQKKVIHVELIDAPPGYRKHYYFGSVAAIYETLPKEIVGISKEALWNVLNNGEHHSRKAIIRHGVLMTKKTNRGKRLSLADIF